MKAQKYYAIRKGHQSNLIVRTWDICKTLTDGFGGAKFKAFKTEKEANDYLQGIDIGKTPEKLHQYYGQTTGDLFKNSYNPADKSVPWTN